MTFCSTCSFSLTLIDAMDTLVIMGNHSEFRRIANILIDKSADHFDIDINASVFETNIRGEWVEMQSHVCYHFIDALHPSHSFEEKNRPASMRVQNIVYLSCSI